NLGLSACCLCACLLSGCLAEKLSEVGTGPQISQIQNPTLAENYAPISMPMPQPTSAQHNINSLWQIGSKAFFKDQRAGKIGDIVTVSVNIDNKESTTYTPDIKKETATDAGLTSFLGLQHQMKRILPHKFERDLEGNNDNKWLKTNSSSSHKGSGKYNLEDQMKFKVSATICQVLPNGNLVIQGVTEMKLMNEVREIQLRGIIRRSDIQSDNSISSDKIAELRVVYAGRGDITDAGNKPWGVQVVEKVMPF
ncbi:MAG: flagellar basal body L-ring protein FlgH, partial [Alphaproteobacteria bacterium]|nr:flagellar basal body L-ring protein FlgH [Alphaproteobacteria bacterium]